MQNSDVVEALEGLRWSLEITEVSLNCGDEIWKASEDLCGFAFICSCLNCNERGMKDFFNRWKNAVRNAFPKQSHVQILDAAISERHCYLSVFSKCWIVMRIPEARSFSELQFKRDIALGISGHRHIWSSIGRERNCISDLEDVSLTTIVTSWLIVVSTGFPMLNGPRWGLVASAYRSLTKSETYQNERVWLSSP